MSARRTALLVSLALLLWLAHQLGGQMGEGELSVEIRDHASGQVVPAMVCITSLADRKWRTPPDGRTAPPFTRVPDFYDPKPWKPGDIGPVRLTNGEYNDNQTRSYVYQGQSAYPFWREPAAYFVTRPFSIRLPAGRWRLAVARGIEYDPVFEEFEIAAGQRRDRKISLRRWVDMAKQGWYSGDNHVHHPRLKPEHDEFLLAWALAEDVHLLNVLQQGTLRGLTFPQQAPAGRHHRKGDYALASGQEDPSNSIGEEGHAIALNIKTPVHDTSRYHLYDLVFDKIHAQGGLTGYAHVAWALEDGRRRRPESHATWDPSIHVPRGKVDFLEVMQFRTLGLEEYYDFLNLGYKLTPSAGSDVPWGATVGEVRVYADTGRAFSPESWFEAFRAGRVFVTNGPMLSVTVNGAGPGEELNVARNARVRVRARAWAPASIGSPARLEIIAHGEVIRSAASDREDKSELSVEFSLPARESQWIAARVTAHNGAQAHSAPVYVLTEGDGFQNRKALPQLVAKRLKVLEYVTGRLRDPKFTAAYAQGEPEELLARLADARRRYESLLRAR